MKQTEIGLIPDDWEVKSLGDITRIQAGGTPSTLFDAYWNGNIRWMNSGELNLKRVYEVEGRITELGLNNSSTHLIPKGCVLIGLAGQGKTRGTAAINYVDLCTNQSIAAIFPSKFHSSDFLYHVMDNKYQELRELSDGGGGRGGLNLKILNDIQIQLPPLAEQQRIAKALSDVDALISTTEKLIQKKKNIKQGAMQNLLTGKKRLPGFGPQTKSPTYKQTELGPIPGDWEVKSLGEICVINPASSNIIPDEFFYVDLESVSSGKLEKKQKIRRRNAPSRAQRQFEKNDILYQTVRPYQRNNLFVNFDSKNYIASTGYAIIRSNNNVDSHYIYQIIHLNNFVNIILDNCTGTSYPAINPKFLKTIPVIIPKKEEQAAIANVLSCMDKEIETLNTKLEKYRNLKTAMMQQLLTGKIRLVK